MCFNIATTQSSKVCLDLERGLRHGISSGFQTNVRGQVPSRKLSPHHFSSHKRASHFIEQLKGERNEKSRSLSSSSKEKKLRDILQDGDASGVLWKYYIIRTSKRSKRDTKSILHQQLRNQRLRPIPSLTSPSLSSASSSVSKPRFHSDRPAFAGPSRTPTYQISYSLPIEYMWSPTERESRAALPHAII